MAGAALPRQNQFDPKPQAQVSLFAVLNTPSPAASGQTEDRLYNQLLLRSRASARWCCERIAVVDLSADQSTCAVVFVFHRVAESIAR